MIFRLITICVFLLVSCSSSPPEEKENVEPAGDPESQKNGIAGRDGVRPPESLEGASLGRVGDSTIPEDMLGVPGGSFTMGLDHKRAIRDERTEHEVTVAPFLLDRTEVTNEAYIECVDAGVCRKPKRTDNSKNNFAPAPEFRTPKRPVSSVSQKDAAAFCKWKKKRLPSEAEFERAARGSDNRLYTWGNEEPTGRHAVYLQNVTADVGSKPAGAGPYGHLDLAGNVWEWTSDHYDPHAYMRETASRGIPADCDEIIRTQDMLRKKGMQGFTGSNPIPTECEHVLRGGAFNYFQWGLRASNRVHHPGAWRMIMSGFRCAKDWPDGPSE